MKLTPWCPMHWRVDSKFEYLREKSSKFETAQGHLSWDQEELFGEANLLKKSREAVPLGC